MISVSVRTAMRWCIFCFILGSLVGPVYIPVVITYILAKLREWGVPLPF